MQVDYYIICSLIFLFFLFFYNYACCLAWLFHNIAMSACNILSSFSVTKKFSFSWMYNNYDIYLDCCRVRLEHARWQAAATRCCDTSQQQMLCVYWRIFWWKYLCRQFDLCNLLGWQNSVGETDFPQNSPVYMKQFVAASVTQFVLIPVHKKLLFAVTCCSNVP